MQLLEILAIIGGADNGPAVLTMAFRDQSEVEAIGLDWGRAAKLSEIHAHDHDDDDYDEYDEELSDDLMVDIMARMFDDASGDEDVIDEEEEDEEDYGFLDDDPGYDDNDRDYVELADQEDYDFED